MILFLLSLTQSTFANGKKNANVIECEQRIRAVALKNYESGLAMEAYQQTMKSGNYDQVTKAHELLSTAIESANHATSEAIYCLYQ